MENEKKREQELPLIDLWGLAHHAWQHGKRLWPLLLIVVVLGGGAMYLRASRGFTPMYKTEALFSISVSYTGTTDMTSYSYYYDNAAAEQVEETFPVLLESDLMKEGLLAELGKDTINGVITAESMGDTNIFVLSVTSTSAQDAYDIIRAVMNVYPRVSQLVLGNTQLSVSNAPELPTEPYNSFSWKRSVAKGVILGAAVDLCILFVLAVLTRTVTSAKDVMEMLNLKCLARVPNIRRKRRSKERSGSLVLNDLEPGSAFIEAFRALKLRLLREMNSPREQIIMFTSSVPSEGKSTIAANTAIALANEGKKVLLIDADLRGQSIKKNLDITKPTIGLGGYLSDAQERYSFARYRDTSLYVFADDEPISSPISLLKHAKLRSLFNELRPLVDYIVVDTPPCSMMADASIFCRYADKVVYVIRGDYASRSQIYDGVQSISASGGKICGFVFNCDSSASHARYGYGYGYGKYGYGYGKYGYAGKEKTSAKSESRTEG